jgi:hypothetical protein
MWSPKEGPEDEGMCYVAADPTQPGAAWAATVDEPKYAKSNAKEIANWIKNGANVMRVPTQTARDMLTKWERPEKKKHHSEQAALF